MNQTISSHPLPNGARPPISMVGLGSVLGVAGTSNPSIKIDASTQDGPINDGAIVDQTIEVVFEAYPAPTEKGSKTGLAILWSINGGPTQSVSAENDSSHTLYLALDQTYTIAVRSEQNGNASGNETRTYTIAGALPERDTDLDGFPDVFEAEYGFSPHDTDLEADNDGSGAPDFVELVCAELAPGMSPILDLDGDGASDCVEHIRGTNPADWQLHHPDVPFASSFYEVEYLLGGTVHADAAATTVQTDIDQLVFASLKAGIVYDSQTLPTDAELSAKQAGLTQADIPSYLRRSVVEPALAAGTIPAGMRITPSQVKVVVATQAESGSEGEAWSVRAWVDSPEDLTPKFRHAGAHRCRGAVDDGQRLAERLCDLLRCEHRARRDGRADACDRTRHHAARGTRRLVRRSGPDRDGGLRRSFVGRGARSDQHDCTRREREDRRGHGGGDGRRPLPRRLSRRASRASRSRAAGSRRSARRWRRSMPT